MTQANEKFEIVRGTTTLDLTDGIKYNVIAFDGFGMAPVKRTEQTGPLQNGATDTGYRLQPRNLRVSLFNWAASANQAHLRHNELLGIFRPGNDVIKLRYTYDDGTVRQIDTYYNGGVGLSSTDYFVSAKWNQRAVVELRAPDPTWYDPSGMSSEFSLSVSGGGFVFPIFTNFFFGSTTLNNSINVALADANVWDTYPTIIITGATTSLKITNTTTGDKLDFTGSSIGTGIVYTIDTRYGYKTVTDVAGANQISKLTSDSNLATFRLVPGDNSITVTGTGLDSNSRIQIQYNTRFIGV